MTKQYKLVKCYPGSVELDTIVTESSEYYHFNTKITGTVFAKDYIENNPEFWEEIKQEEYTILSIRRKEEELLGWVDEWTPEENYGLSLRTMLEIGECVNSDHFYINSIRRNSDGEIFTIGDMCNPIGQHCKNRHKITKIEFCKAGYLRIGSNNYYLSIRLIEHSEKLFTTKDGVDLYKNDEYYTVLTGSNSAISGEVNGPYVADVRYYVHYDIEYFSSEEKAQEFLDSLKPKVLFTTEDGIGLYEGDFMWAVHCCFSWLKAKVLVCKNPFKGSPNQEVKYFSTEKAAECYILLNKPCLSINEVIGVLESNVIGWGTTRKITKAFKNHVKLKS